MKKKVLIIGIIVLFIAACIAIFLLLNKKVTISFDADGGTEVQSVEVKKGGKIVLPVTTKEGYILDGWYIDTTKVGKDTTYDKDVTLRAKWISETAKTFTVTFDSDGGTAVETITVECGKELSLPTNPTKTGYKFLSWIDKNSTPIYDKALLACENITLKANWEKEETKVETKKETKEPTKTYSCPSGYTLNGTKCTIEGTVREKCGERGFDYEGKCVTITYNARENTKDTCGKTTVHTGGGHTEEVEGDLYKIGTNYCFFKLVEDSYESNSSNCTSRGHYWNSIIGKCYYYRGAANQYVTSTCSHLSGYVYITNPNSYEGVNGLNGGCYPLSNKTKYCDEGYTLTSSKCIKTIDATLK